LADGISRCTDSIVSVAFAGDALVARWLAVAGRCERLGRGW
jgi:hypothetical protein